MHTDKINRENRVGKFLEYGVRSANRWGVAVDRVNAGSCGASGLLLDVGSDAAQGLWRDEQIGREFVERNKLQQLGMLV